MLSTIWLLGMLVLTGYGIVGSFRVEYQLRFAVPVEQQIWECDTIHTSFLWGLFHPRIYLPSGMNEETKRYVIRHERAHQKRGDHWWKVIGYVLLVIYWFQPLMWIAYWIFARDIEYACDEHVIGNLSFAERKEYAQALLLCGSGRSHRLAGPLAFGGIGVKPRIKNVLFYQKPGRGKIAISLLVCVVVSVCFLTNPKDVNGMDAEKHPVNMEAGRQLDHVLSDKMHMVFDGKTVLISVISIVLFWAVTIISTKGVSWISKITSISGVARIILGLGFIVLSFGVILFLGKAPAQEFTAETIMPKFNWSYFMVLAWILQAVGGAESIGVYIKDVKGGNKTFIRTMVISTAIVGGLYALGAVSVGLVVPSEVLQGNFSNGLFDAFAILGANYGVGNIITNIVGFIMMLASLGSLVLWTAAPVKVLFSEIPEGIFGKWIAKTDKKGTPVNALYVQAVIVTVLLLVPALGIGSVDSLLEMLINMTASTSLIPVLFFLVGYIVLRAKKDDMERSFKVGSKNFGIAIGVLLLALFVFVFVISSIPAPQDFAAYFNGTLAEGATNPVFVLLYNVLGLVFFLGFAEICWRKYEKKVGKAVANEWDQEEVSEIA